MPFQHKINAESARLYFLNYDRLKSAIRDPSEFASLIESEIEKVNLYAILQHDSIFSQLQTASKTLNVETTLDRLSQAIIDLDTFTRLNYEGFVRLAEKYDRCVRSSGSVWLLARLSREPFANLNIEDLLVLLSVSWTRWRSESEGQWEPPASFVRSTAKYWVKTDRVMRLKTALLKHIPLLIFDASLKEQEALLSPAVVADPTNPTIPTAQLISSVYFDSPDLKCYSDRLLRKEGSRLLRMRWYGRNDGRDDKEIFIERKVHHESWSKLSSSKDRISLPQAQIASFIAGNLNVPSALGHEVASMIQTMKLKPMVRTCYYRSAFQRSDSNRVRVSLDTQLTLINEATLKTSDSWCRVANDVLVSDDVARFPYCVLEVKLQDSGNPPAWVNAALDAAEAVQVHKFSKFLHGIAFLHPKRVSLVPHWLPEIIPKPEAVSTGSRNEQPEERIERILHSHSSYASERLVESEEVAPLHVPIGSSIRQVKDMWTVEPKTIFANERTFIHYTLKGLYLLGVAMAVRTGIAVIVVMVYIGWCLLSFIQRQNVTISQKAVQKNLVRLDLKHGPAVLLGVVLISLASFCRD